MLLHGVVSRAYTPITRIQVAHTLTGVILSCGWLLRGSLHTKFVASLCGQWLGT